MQIDYRKSTVFEIKGIAECIKRNAELLGGYSKDLGAYATDNDAENKAHIIFQLADDVVKQMNGIIQSKNS